MKCLVFIAFAQNQPLIFERIQKGFPGVHQWTIYGIAQDDRGFIWFATGSGLYRYDGRQFKDFTYHPLDSLSLRDNFLRDIDIGKDRYLWVGLKQGGLNRYDPKFQRFDDYPLIEKGEIEQMPHPIVDIMISSQDMMWVGTEDGLWNMDLKQDTSFLTLYQSNKTDVLSRMYITSLLEDDNGNIWIGTFSEGLICLNPNNGEITKIPFEENLKNKNDGQYVLSLEIDLEGNIWISTNEGRLHKYNPHSKLMNVFSLSPSSNLSLGYEAMDMLIDSNGKFWIATREKGLLLFDPNSGTYLVYHYDVENPFSIGSDFLTVLYEDEAKTLWIGHSDAGISKLDLQHYHLQPLAIPLKSLPEIDAGGYKYLLENDLGVWIGSYSHGFFYWNPLSNQLKQFKHEDANPNSLSHNMVWCLTEDSNKNIWIGTMNGLNKFNPLDFSFQHFLKKNEDNSGLWHQGVSALLEDHSGKLWIGTFAGLNWMDVQSNSIQRFLFPSEESQPANHHIFELFEDRDYFLWISVHGRGVYRLNQETGEIVHYFHDKGNIQSLSHNVVWDIYQDRKGAIWLTTEGGGLNLFLPNDQNPETATFKHWRPYNSELPEDIIFQIVAEDQDYLWLTGSIGLYRFNSSDHNIKSYALRDKSRLELQIDPLTKPKMYFGSPNYIYFLQPERLESNEYIPPVHLTNIYLFNDKIPIENTYGDTLNWSTPLTQALGYTKSLKFYHDQNDLTFEYACLNFIRSNSNQYQYRLEGYDDDWISADANQLFARYTNLSPGNYTFRVIGSNNDEVWNKEGASIDIFIQKAWWQRWWAYSMYILLLIIGTHVIYKYQLTRKLALSEASRLMELDKIKSRFFTNITHEFRTPLTLIMGMTEQIAAFWETYSRTQIDHAITTITNNAESLLNLVNQLLELARVDAKNIQLELQSGDVIRFIDGLIKQFKNAANLNRIHLEIVHQAHSLVMDFDAGKLQQIMMNLLGNSLKFTASSGSISVHTKQINTLDSPILEIRIRDTGIGISEDELPYIFDRFYQIKNKNSPHLEGTGIGLSLVKELVNLMEGKITVESKLDEGTTFIVCIPIRTQIEATEKKSATPKASPIINSSIPLFPPETFPLPNEKPKLLIIEDNQQLLAYLQLLLQDEYLLLLASDGEKGIQKAIEYTPDIILSDVMMPVKDGFEVCRTLKQDERTSHIPIILLTAKATSEDKISGWEYGADAYLTKPFKRNELFARIRQLITQRKELQKKYLLSIPNLPKDSFPKNQREHSFLLNLRKIIEKNIDNENLNIEKVCEEIGMSRSQVHRKLKAITDLSTSHYIRKIRLHKAKNLLESTELGVWDVSVKVGFKERTHFSRSFSEEFGLPPSFFKA